MLGSTARSVAGSPYATSRSVGWSCPKVAPVAASIAWA